MAERKIIDPEPEEVANFEELRFLRIVEPINVLLIPKELIEEVKGRTFTLDQFYRYQTIQIENKNSGNFLYILVDKSHKIKGFLWAEINGMDGSLFINTFSVAKEYWGKGKAIPFVVEFLKELKKKVGAPRVFWISTNEKFFLKKGFKKSKNILLEYQDVV
jgi:hypothetical protein